MYVYITAFYNRQRPSSIILLIIRALHHLFLFAGKLVRAHQTNQLDRRGIECKVPAFPFEGAYDDLFSINCSSKVICLPGSEQLLHTESGHQFRMRPLRSQFDKFLPVAPVHPHQLKLPPAAFHRSIRSLSLDSLTRLSHPTPSPDSHRLVGGISS